MYKIDYSTKFKKSLKKIRKSGRFDLKKLNDVIETLSLGKKLDIKYRDHKLKGEFKDLRECHVEPDLLLVYKRIKTELILVLVDLGSHSELF